MSQSEVARLRVTMNARYACMPKHEVATKALKTTAVPASQCVRRKLDRAWVDSLPAKYAVRDAEGKKKAAIGIVVEHPPMAVERSYTVVLFPEPQAGGFSVSVPALHEIATQGETEEEAVANAREAISLVVSDRAERGEDIPPSDTAAPRFERIAIAA